MTEHSHNGLLDGLEILDLAGEFGTLAGRVFADLGACVATVTSPGNERLPPAPPTTRPGRFAVSLAEVATFAARAAVIIDAPVHGAPEAAPISLEVGDAPHAVWVHITAFGADGPRSTWRASDLGVMASSGNLFCTGDPDRPPVRPSQPAAYAHTGPEVVFAALTALASGRPQEVDLSMQEVVLIANMANPASFPRTGFRGRRIGANVGRTREIWPTSDGWISFGLRGGKARVPSLELLTKLVTAEGDIEASALRGRDWSSFSPNTATDEELRAIEAAVAEYFSRHTMTELYDIACETNMMMAPINSPREIYASKQLGTRGFFGMRNGVMAPQQFCTVTPGPTSTSTTSTTATTSPAPRRAPQPHGTPAWEGLKILEFGSGAAGPIASRYFAEHGATVLRVESRGRPDFLRVYALGPDNPHGLEGAPMYDGLNVSKRNVLLNLKHPDAVALAKRLVVEWADVVSENFAPRAMRSFGLDYDSLAALKPDLVMISACLNGQTGPHKDYPGFGGQGAALSGFNYVTGWPDRAPVGPFGTITDSLAPRFVAAALAAALWRRERTGHGAYVDVSQVETASYALAPWLVRYQTDGVIDGRIGNRSRLTAPHGVFPCVDEDGITDRWIALATWNDDEWARLAEVMGLDDPTLRTAAARLERVDEVEGIVAAFTRPHSRVELATRLQGLGIEAVPVADFADLHADPQLSHRGHFVPLTHPYMGACLYERNGFRLSDAASGYERSGPTLGQDQDWVLGELLGLSPQTRAALAEDHAFD